MPFKRTEGNSGHGLGRIGGTAPMEMTRERFQPEHLRGRK